jgi:hypothetical protein
MRRAPRVGADAVVESSVQRLFRLAEVEHDASSRGLGEAAAAGR